MSKVAFTLYQNELNMETRINFKEDLEKLFLTNLHKTFSKHKSDFTEAFELIKNYMSKENYAPFLSSFCAVKAVTELSYGLNYVTLNQNILG